MHLYYQRVIIIFLVYTILFMHTAIGYEERDLVIEHNGYIVFCPCMGRFGNQVDHYLGALGFAAGLNRTLILPPWVEYNPGVPRSVQVPFSEYFDVETLKTYHRVIEMGEFMEKIAHKIWPPEKRIAFCYMARQNSSGCSPKEGNPFGPFWDTYNIDFVGSELYQPLTYDVYHQNMSSKWKEKYPSSHWPVLAFTGAPASFPIQSENRKLQKYLHWNKAVMEKANNEIAKLPRGPFVAIHLRNGIDWVRACKHVDQSPLLFAAPQCLGHRGEHGSATMELCLPSKDTIIKQLKRVVKSISAKSVFIASDSDHMTEFLSAALKKLKTTVHKMENPEPHVELAVMGIANHFIGNCVSSFSAFAKRERDVKGFPSSFWAFPSVHKKQFRSNHSEL